MNEEIGEEHVTELLEVINIMNGIQDHALPQGRKDSGGDRDLPTLDN